jgi:serine/threonine protein kinase
MIGNICSYDETDLLPLTLGEPGADEVRAHLEAGCPSCGNRLERLKGEVTRLRRAAQSATAACPCGSAPDRIPGTVGKYFIVGTLGKGARGVTYRALNPVLNRQTVIKLSHRPLGEDPAERQRLIREGQVLARLKHPNLAGVYDLDFHDNRPFLVTEYVRGRPLEQAVAHGRPTPRRAAGLIAQTARALSAAHERGVVHGGITPQSIRIDDDGRPRLVGFGLDWPGGGAGDEAAAAAKKSTFPRARPDPAGDIAALGGVLYFLLTGRDLSATGGADRDKVVLLQARVPRGLKTICLKALAAGSVAGYARALDLAEALDRFLDRPGQLARWGGLAALALLAVASWWLL